MFVMNANIECWYRPDKSQNVSAGGTAAAGCEVQQNERNHAIAAQEHYGGGDSSRDYSNDNVCIPVTRKKRRGLIEKKRRDKINYSLAELKRLVPTANAKEGSAKLEKAEILQLTVDYLKSQSFNEAAAAGGGQCSYAGHQNLIMEGYTTGMHDCFAEISGYLETFNMADELKFKLVEHFRAFVAQRAPAASYGQDYSKHFYYKQPPATGYPPTPLLPHHHAAHHPNVAPPMTHVPVADARLCQESYPSGEGDKTTYTDLSNYKYVHGADVTSGGYNSYCVNSPRPYRPWGAEIAY